MLRTSQKQIHMHISDTANREISRPTGKCLESGWTPQRASFHHLNSEDYYLAIKGCTYKGIHARELLLSYFQMYFTYFQMCCAPPS